MTSLTTTQDQVASVEADAIIVGWTADDTVAAHPLLSDEARETIAAGASLLDASSKAGKVTVVPGAGTEARRVVVVGIGSGSEADLRAAAGEASRQVGKKPSKVVVALPAEGDAAIAVAQGAVLGAYSFTDYKSDENAATDTEWVIAGASDEAIARANILIAAAAGIRDLVNTPPLDLFPGSFAEIAQQMGAEAGVDVDVWDAQRLANEGFGGILAVGMGSARLPRLVRVAYAPEGASQKVALVGKGITFDTGGISLKPSKSMETMKSDMTGAATVLHAVVAAARAELPIAVTGWLCIAENMPSGTAQRPSDVIRIYGGQTVEVLNTDAEGRLVMADGLVKAREENPDVLLDVATLTGAQGVALGTRTSGVMGTAEIRDEVVAAANEVDEAMWAMPLPEHLRESIDSKIADLQNIGDPQGGGMLSAGIFLREFVGDTPWAHLDIARPSYNEGKPWAENVAGSTGHSLRTLFRFLEARAQA
ncbi:leucyl aminopeptidase [Demequina sp. SYSU T00192]|uniref:Probable cytosol aminopeptidase n=1 Tax=Demequina litoralis TaxID=3051660 RepID=A0ABT8G655_9MICO|nr:leucyl aminopeptidase [Demequina sp. SYSU T00192]MDN4474620.1 leucyl aminopeptidase [Demequina sp. SYSU T00192]